MLKLLRQSGVTLQLNLRVTVFKKKCFGHLLIPCRLAAAFLKVDEIKTASFHTDSRQIRHFWKHGM